MLDLTASQFKTPVPYLRGKGCGFLTREPSKRARGLMKMMVWQTPAQNRRLIEDVLA